MNKIIGSNIILTFDESKITVQRFRTSNPFERPELFSIPLRYIYSVKYTRSIKWFARGHISITAPGTHLDFYFTYQYEKTIMKLVDLINSKAIGV